MAGKDKEEFATATVNLLAAITNAIKPGELVARSTLDLVRWLSREGVDEARFQQCAKLAKGLVYPNEHGLSIGDKIRDAEQKFKLPGIPLSLVRAGSLGRLVGLDDDFRYIVSTTATLSAFRDCEWIADAISAMILDAGGHEQGVHFRYSIQQAPTEAVIKKIVESVWVNVINTGNDLGSLPDEFSEQSPRLLSNAVFSATTMAIFRSKSDLLMRSSHFFGDLTSWILAHFHGEFIVSVGNQVKFQKKLGSSANRLRYLIDSECNELTCCRCTLSLGQVIGDGTSILVQVDVSEMDDTRAAPRSYLRRPFYSHGPATKGPLENFRKSQSGQPIYVNKLLEVTSRAIGRLIMEWILGLELCVPYPKWSGRGIIFKTTLQQHQEGNNRLTIGTLLQAFPSLCQGAKAQLSAPSAVIFQPSELAQFPKHNAQSFNLEPIFNCFPPMMSWLKGLRNECFCVECTMDFGVDGDVPKPKSGCLKHWACHEVLTLIGHAIADGFGAADVSGGGNQETMVKEVFFLLVDLILQKEVKWTRWFGVAAMFITGCDTIIRDSPSGLGLTELAAFQYGGLSVLASWLKVDQSLQVQGSFGLQCAAASIDGMSDHTGYLHCEGHCFSDAPATTVADGAWQWSETLEDDETRAEVTSVIFRTGISSYRLVCIVETFLAGSLKAIRPFDPSMALVGYCHARWATCNCTGGATHEVPSMAAWAPLQVSNFETILSDWNPLRRSGMQVSKVLRSHLKINIALSLCCLGSVLRTKGTCQNCAVRAVSALPCPVYEAHPPLRIITTAVGVDDDDTNRLLGPATGGI